ncbi:MAG: aconitase X swivel domain-containing protein [Candidatus Nezhaarchaeales archaeon]
MSKRGSRTITFRGKGIVKGYFRGEALVTNKPISFLGGVDSSTGIVLEKNHDLEGATLAGKVLLMPHGKGSTVGSYVIYGLAKRKLAPGAIVTIKVDLMTLTGCVISEIPLIDRVPEEALSMIKSGDIIEIDAFRGLVKVISR